MPLHREAGRVVMSESPEGERAQRLAGQMGHCPGRPPPSARLDDTSASAAQRPARGVVRQPAYSEDARSYDRMTRAYQGFRRAIVDALPVRPGQVVLDVGCGTGRCFGLLIEKVGAEGGVVGIEESPEMVVMALEIGRALSWGSSVFL